MRCFVAVELPDPVRRSLAGILNAAPRGDGVVWVRSPQLHVTLKFLGDVPEDRVRVAGETILAASAGIAPFTLSTAPLGAFPDERQPHVLWCGVRDPAGACAAWVAAAEPMYERFGVPRDTRPYTPHITLARAKAPAGAAVLRKALQLRPPPAISWTVAYITLFESRLTPAGAEYRIVARAALADAAGAAPSAPAQSATPPTA